MEISWGGSLALDCGDPGDPSGVNNKDSFYSGTAEITCNVGYTGGGTITCLEDGSWNKTTAIPCALVGELFSIHLIRSGDKVLRKRCIIDFFSYFSTKIYVVGMVLLCTQTYV